MCEIRHLFPIEIRATWTDAAQHTHHIMIAGRGIRWDLRSNLIRISAMAHEFVHRHPVDGRVICLWLKHSKGELNESEFHTASSMHLAGWIARASPSLSWTDKYLDRLRLAYP